MLASLYNFTIRLADHHSATLYLAIVSFVESSFFPVPPDLILVPMAVAKPNLAWKYALIATIFSVLGGIFGYTLGYLFEPVVLQWLQHFGYAETYSSLQDLFNRWGFWTVVLAGVTPIPYKIFTLGSGLLKFNFVWFGLASIIGRGLRFFIVSLILQLYAKQIDDFVRKFLCRYGSIVLILGLCIFFL